MNYVEHQERQRLKRFMGSYIYKIVGVRQRKSLENLKNVCAALYFMVFTRRGGETAPTTA